MLTRAQNICLCSLESKTAAASVLASVSDVIVSPLMTLLLLASQLLPDRPFVVITAIRAALQRPRM